MKKLRLSVEDIAVESFATLPQGARRGTVGGHGYSDTTCNQIICDCPTNGYEHTCNTCQASCNGSCEASCDGTCVNCPGPSAGGTCDASCDWTCGSTCEGYSCRYCTQPGQIVCA